MKTSPRTGALMPVRGFSKVRPPARFAPTLGFNAAFWRNSRGVLVSSIREDMTLPGGEGKRGPTWMLAVSVREWGGEVRRPTAAEMLEVVADFAVEDGWEEDNHMPGNTRTLFIPCDPRYRGICECKLNEQVVVEDDGYTWTNAIDAETDRSKCRDCELVAVRLLGGLEPGSCRLHG